MRSTESRATASRKRPEWLTIGILCLALGLGAIAFGAPWTWLADGGWPWTGSITQVTSGYDVTITHPQGRTETFHAVTSDEAARWMNRRNTELKHDYDLDTKMAAGRVLMLLGSGLAAAGGGVLVWRAVRGATGRRSKNGDAVSVH